MKEVLEQVFLDEYKPLRTMPIGCNLWWDASRGRKERLTIMKTKYPFAVFAALAAACVLAAGQPQPEVSQKAVERIQKEVRHELLMLPYLDVFDNLAYKVEGYNVTLMGQVTRPTLKSDSENVVKRIEGVEKVDNQIEVLPTSPMDDEIRLATYRAIYGNSVLSPYGLRAVPPI